jgi:hypothetical protein
MDKQFNSAKETLFWRFSVLLNTFVADFTNIILYWNLIHVVFDKILHKIMINFSKTLIITLLFLSCNEAQDSANAVPEGGDERTLVAADPIMELLDFDRTGIDFKNSIIETYENNITNNINTYNGGGICIADINNDNLPDIYFIGSNGDNKMYQNLGRLKFKDITAAAGLNSEDGFETAITAVDINADGWLDFYVCRAGVEQNDVRRNRLYINNKDLTFSEKSAEYGIDDKSASTGANFFDYDNDGDLDLYVLNYPTEGIWTNKIDAKLGADGKYHPLLDPRSEYDTDRFYRNDNGKFTDVSKTAGIWNLAYGLSVSVSDINRDGWVDIYVGNDFIQPDKLYINNKKGGFTDQLDQFFKHNSQHTMGTDLTDFDNDGLVDLYAVDMLPNYNARNKSYLSTNTQSKQTAVTQNGYFEPVVRNILQHNNGNGTFSDVGCMAGVYKTDWSWSGLLFDMDNDGLRDIHVTNGYRRDVTNRDFMDFVLPDIQKKNGSIKSLKEAYPNFDDFINLIPSSPKLRNFCYKNTGNLSFEDKGGQWMTAPASWSCGAAWGDLDADGDLDLVVNNLEQPAFIYENKSVGKTGNNYLQLKLNGDSKNPFAVGASALIEYDNGHTQYAELYPSRGIFSSVEHLLHFGIGKVNKIDKLTVRWPNGKTHTLSNITANQRLILQQNEANGVQTNSISPTPPKEGLYFSVGNGLAFAHKENDFNDFEQWPLNPWKTTELGPFTVAGDVNGDGLDDLFMGASFDQPAAMLLQKPDGSFAPAATNAFELDKAFEDHGACFFDADKDQDLDLFVVSGGAESTNPAAWQSRLYINLDGKGNFLKAPAIPQLPGVGGRVTTYDYDNDGDLDLFIGGRVLPTKWPLTPQSVILRNDRTKFTDVTNAVSPDFERCGMVTDLQWINVDTDPALELVVCGEWMPLSIFKIKGSQIVNVTKSFGLEKSNGIWFRMATGDLDGDGDMDIVTGNLGQNTRFEATESTPFRCFAADFDKNSIIDPILAFYESGNLYPLVQKDVLVKQIPSLKKKFLKASVYGQATMDQVYPSSDLEAALNLYCYTFASCWWENKDGKFIKHELPRQAQTSANQGIIISDFTHDGKPDILLAGNKHGMEAETNACDAGIGTLLAGDGKGGFSWVNNTIAGFWARGEVRDMALLKGVGGKQYIVVGNNNEKAQLYYTK